MLDAFPSAQSGPDALAAGVDHAQLHLINQSGVDGPLSLTADLAAAALLLPGPACLCHALRYACHAVHESAAVDQAQVVIENHVDLNHVCHTMKDPDEIVHQVVTADQPDAQLPDFEWPAAAAADVALLVQQHHAWQLVAAGYSASAVLAGCAEPIAGDFAVAGEPGLAAAACAVPAAVQVAPFGDEHVCV